MAPEEEWIRGEPSGESADPGDEVWRSEPRWPARPAGLRDRRRGHGGAPWVSLWLAAVVAVVAATAGVAVVLLLAKGSPAAPAVTAVGGSGPVPRSSASQPGGAGPPSPGPATGTLRMLLIGQVLAVSAHSITIGGDGQPVTAAVSGSTAVTGKAAGIGGVKVGDKVSARITGTPGHLTATAIQDPARIS